MSITTHTLGDAFTVASPNGGRKYLPNPSGANQFRGFSQEFVQFAANFAPLALNSTATENAVTCYLTGESDFTNERGGLLRWVRTYHSIPATERFFRGSLAFTYPARQAVAGSSQAVTAFAPISGSRATYTANAHGFTNGQTVFVTVVKQDIANRRITGSIPVQVSNVTTNTFDAADPAAIAGYTFVSGSVATFQPAQPARTLGGSTYEEVEYILPGVTAGFAAALDVLPLPVFAVRVAATGELVEDNRMTAATSPTPAEYADIVARGGYLVAESVVEEYAGLILQRRTTYVRAQ